MAIPGNQVQVMSPFQERLASIPEYPRKVAPGDGGEPTGPTALARQNNQTTQPSPSPAPQAPQAPTLQQASPATKFLAVEQLVRSQDAIARNRWAIDTHFRRIRSGVPFSRLEKIPNQSIWVQKMPTGMSKESSASVPNKADDLCNKVEDTLMADPPKADPQPHVNDEAAKEAAELASQFLNMDGGEAGTNDIQTYRWALNNAFTAASSFLHYVVNPTGGGYQPAQILAHPQATDPQNPLVAQITTTDPTTGQPVTVEERATNPVLRYVSPPTPDAPKGQFVESADQADKAWLPSIVIERHRRESVRMFPPTATVEDCAALVLIRNMTLADARTEWPDTVGQMDHEALFALANWRPVMSELVVPFALRGALQSGASGPTVDEVGSLSPQLQRRMFAYRLYVPASPEYPGGYVLDVTGANGGQVLGEADLEYTVQTPTAGPETRCRDIPVVQVRPQQDVDGGDPTGWPFIARFAGPSEAEATLYAAFQDLCDNMLHPHVFLPATQTIDEDDWLDRTRPITIDPTAPKVFYEEFPTLPPVLELVQNMDQKMDTISGLTATAQGLDSPNAQSGTAKNLTIRQALVSLSGFQQNLHAAMTRGWRIKCQLAQAAFTTPMLMQFAGEEGSSEPQWWTGEDLAGVDRVGIQPGTGTMMTPEAKAQYVAFLQTQQWMDPQEAAKVALPTITMDLGLPKNPFEQAIKRAIATWKQGPTQSWLQAKQAQDQAIQQAQAAYQADVQAIQQQAQANGHPVMTPPPFQPPPLPPLPTPFMPRPNDGEPKVAATYASKLSELFVDPQYAKQPPAWQQVANDAYARYVQVLTPQPTIPPNIHINAMPADPASLMADVQAAEGKMPPGGGGPQAPGAPNGGVPMPAHPAPAHVPPMHPMGGPMAGRPLAARPI